MKSDDHFISPLNKSNIVPYRNSINNSDSDKNNSNDSSSDSGNDGYSVKKMRMMVQIKKNKPGILVNHITLIL